MENKSGSAKKFFVKWWNMITKETTIEALVETKDEAVQYLKDKGIRCILCGEPIWGTIEEAAKEKGFSDEEISEIVKELNELK
ncbi:DUF1858 domain-containing protein [Flexistipes sinusarabici]|nr:DUF1858 domain-containing protein [Flexistipes sinusarabici]